MATWTLLTYQGQQLYWSVRQVALASGETNPTNDATVGVQLLGTRALLPVVSAPNGQTFNGAGALRAWVYSPVRALWVRAPRADEDLSDFAGLAIGTLPALPVVFDGARFMYVPDTVGLSGGTEVTIDYYMLHPYGSVV